VVSGVAFDKARSERRAFDGLVLGWDVPTIVMVHASLEAYEGQLERYHPFARDELVRSRASYVALGHYHRFSDLGSACYPGTPEGISFDAPETGDRFVVVGEIGDDGTATFESVKINQRVMKSVDLDCTQFDSSISLFDTVRKLCDRNSLLQLRFKGTPVSEVNSALWELEERFRESCLYITADLDGISSPPDLPVDDCTIRGRFCSHILGQIEECADPERRRVLQRALELGLAAFSEE
jgi:DNA repair exonuclease SbcCD nuclease subunit